jgi:hypothetical protein
LDRAHRIRQGAHTSRLWACQATERQGYALVEYETTSDTQHASSMPSMLIRRSDCCWSVNNRPLIRSRAVERTSVMVPQNFGLSRTSLSSGGAAFLEGIDERDKNDYTLR